MKVISRFLATLAFGALAFIAQISHAAVTVAVVPPKVLILYDAPAGDKFEKLGFSYAIMLQNLMGHFDASVSLKATQDYVKGSVENYDATFYLGSYYDAPLSVSLLTDLSTTKKTVVWFKDNIWKMAWDPAYNFQTRTGLCFTDLVNFDSAPSSTNPQPGFFDTVKYKGKSFVKYYSYDATTGAVNADPDTGIMKICNPALAQSLVPIVDSKTGAQTPYISRSGNFWYFADVPFSYIGPRDRYLVLTDMLHDILAIPHSENHRALIRLEDVSALVSVQAMKTLTDYMHSASIPFSIATIPFYRDPLGLYNGQVPQEIPLSQASNLKTALNYAVSRHAEIVMHGYTHQYASKRNRYTAISGDDYEFWDIIANTPVAEDSTQWALDRLKQ